ncbi:7160_t:CDS:10 [Diversispora eburnea]|uniref:Conserved oligomeric Golgi complex subunit 8 n=1 Tax=Diversispora eburnea TaxID=1213867 RepID=A0A9N9FKL2_9GLOM|nr:7160_t:CDS:10 [Diversispora eburnea]
MDLFITHDLQTIEEPFDTSLDTYTVDSNDINTSITQVTQTQINQVNQITESLLNSEHDHLYQSVSDTSGQEILLNLLTNSLSIQQKELINKEWSKDYLNRLTSLPFESLKHEPALVINEESKIQKELAELSFREYKSCIYANTCSTEINSSLDNLNTRLSELISTIPTLENLCTSFSQQITQISQQRNKINVMMEQHDNLLEILEIPQLMDICVQNGYYSEAMDLSSHVSKLILKYSSIPLIQNIEKDVKQIMQLMLSKLITLLSQQIKLPSCLKVIGYLRRMEAFDEAELRLIFLLSRDTYLKSDERITLTATTALADYTIHILEQLTLILIEFTPLISDTSSLSSILTQLMYCGMSLGRVGVDFRHLITEYFETAVDRIISKMIFDGTQEFCDDLKQAIKNIDLPSRWMIVILLDYPPLAYLTNAYLSTFNALRLVAPVSLFYSLGEQISQSLLLISNLLRDYGNILIQNDHDITILLGFNATFSKSFVPFISRCFIEGVYGGMFGGIDQVEIIDNTKILENLKGFLPTPRIPSIVKTDIKTDDTKTDDIKIDDKKTDIETDIETDIKTNEKTIEKTIEKTNEKTDVMNIEDNNINTLGKEKKNEEIDLKSQENHTNELLSIEDEKTENIIDLQKLNMAATVMSSSVGVVDETEIVEYTEYTEVTEEVVFEDIEHLDAVKEVVEPVKIYNNETSVNIKNIEKVDELKLMTSIDAENIENNETAENNENNENNIEKNTENGLSTGLEQPEEYDVEPHHENISVSEELETKVESCSAHPAEPLTPPKSPTDEKDKKKSIPTSIKVPKPSTTPSKSSNIAKKTTTATTNGVNGAHPTRARRTSISKSNPPTLTKPPGARSSSTSRATTSALKQPNSPTLQKTPITHNKTNSTATPAKTSAPSKGPTKTTTSTKAINTTTKTTPSTLTPKPSSSVPLSRKVSSNSTSSNTSVASKKSHVATNTTKSPTSTTHKSKTSTSSSNTTKSVSPKSAPKQNGVGKASTAESDFKVKNEELTRQIEEKDNLLKSSQEELEILRAQLVKGQDSASESVEQQVQHLEELKKAHEEETLKMQIDRDEAILVKEAEIDLLSKEVKRLKEELKNLKKQEEEERKSLVVSIQEEHAKLIEQTKNSSAEEIAQLTEKVKNAEAIAEPLKAELEPLKVEVGTLKAEAETLKAELELQHANAIEQAKELSREQAINEFKTAQGGNVIAVETLKLKHLDEVAELKKTHSQELQDLKDAHEEEIENAKLELQTLLEKQHSANVANIEQMHYKESKSIRFNLESKYDAVLQEQAALKSQHSQAIEDLKNHHAQEIELLKSSADQELVQKFEAQIAELKLQHENQLKSLQVPNANSEQQCESEITELKEKYETAINDLKASHESQLSQLQGTNSVAGESFTKDIEELMVRHAKEINDLKASHAAELQQKIDPSVIDELKASHVKELEELQKTKDELVSEIDQINAYSKQSIHELRESHSQELQETITALDKEIKKKEQDHLEEINQLKSQRSNVESEAIEDLKLKHQNEKDTMLNQIASFKKQIKDYEEQLKEITENINLLTKDLETEKSSNESKIKEVTELYEEEIARMKATHDEEMEQKLHESSIKDNSSLESLHIAHKLKIAELEKVHAQVLEEKEELLKSKSMENRWLEEENDQQDAKIAEQNKEIEKFNIETQKHRLDLDELRKENELLKAENDQMLKLIHKLQAELVSHQL